MSAADGVEGVRLDHSPRRAWWRRLLGSRVLWAYVLLLGLSHAVTGVWQPDVWGIDAQKDVPGAERLKLKVAGQSAAGAVAGHEETISLLKFSAGQGTGTRASRGREARGNGKGTGAVERVPVVLLHGSPSGGAADFRVLGGVIAASGRDVYAVDFPGFGKSGQWVPDYSIGANARYVLAALESLGIARAHVVGWSQGGGSALFAADIVPSRVASVTLLGSIGVQEAEGSGSYAFEHTKYAVGWFGLVALPEALPHFGLLGPRHFRHAFIRNFMDSDQRELEPLMERLATPTLIVHGRRDFLVPDWCAQMTHELVKPSRLVMLDSSHFFPMGREKDLPAMHDAAAAMTAFFERHDAPGVPALVGSVSYVAHKEKIKSELGGMKISHGMEWWLVILAIVVGTLILEDMTLIAVGLLISDGQIDPFVGLFGCFIGIVVGDMFLWGMGRLLGRRLLRFRVVSRFVTEKALVRWGDMLDNHMGKAIFLCRCIPGTRMPTYIAAGMLGRKTAQFVFWELMAVCVWAPALLLLSGLVGPKVLGLFREVFHGPVAIVIALVVLFFVVRAVSAEATYEGRHKNKAGLQRLWRYEFWPTWAMYLPMVPSLLWHALRRGPTTFTCVNPGVENGGGWIGESKSLILRNLMDRSLGERAWEDARVAPFVHVPGGPDAGVRAAVVVDAVRSNPSLGGYPIVLKPDQGQRGHGLKVAKSDDDVRAYFDLVSGAVVAQRCVALPNEVGVLWARRVPVTGRVDDAPGEIVSITRKRFPVIEGDGERALDHLIWDHPRFQMQAGVFLARLGKDAERVPAKGERVSLGFSGNHCQGTMFMDGSDLITPELSAAIERLCQRYRDDQGRRFDFGRFDLRFTTEEELKRGEGFVAIELNGSSSESTNLYDPSKNMWWALGVLRRQWARLFALGAARRREGVRPVGMVELVRMSRAAMKALVGPRVSD
jgi:pimeloyl-ACP methyl ester carboxylesterase/membrane protein DedA with SNARE-associated domain